MTTVQKAVDGSQPLSYLQSTAQQQEGIYGPLTAITAQAPNNVITLEVGPSPEPGKRVILETYDGHPPEKPDHDLICIATCLVNGSMAKVAAYRPD
jgi:hypothetical protein